MNPAYRQLSHNTARKDTEHPCTTVAIATLCPPCAMWQESVSLQQRKPGFAAQDSADMYPYAALFAKNRMG